MDNNHESHEFLRSASEKLRTQSKKIEIDKGADKLPERSERTAKMSIGAEHATHETEALNAAQPSAEELGITDELCEYAVWAGFAAKDFSVAFFAKTVSVEVYRCLQPARCIAAKRENKEGFSCRRYGLQRVKAHVCKKIDDRTVRADRV